MITLNLGVAGCLLLLSCGCVVAVVVLWLFLMVPWVGLPCVVYNVYLYAYVKETFTDAAIV